MNCLILKIMSHQSCVRSTSSYFQKMYLQRCESRHTQTHAHFKSRSWHGSRKNELNGEWILMQKSHLYFCLNKFSLNISTMVQPLKGIRYIIIWKKPSKAYEGCWLQELGEGRDLPLVIPLCKTRYWGYGSDVCQSLTGCTRTVNPHIIYGRAMRLHECQCNNCAKR